MLTNIGLMQGRLSPLIGNKIQVFPVNNWQREFKIINKTSLNLIEWTLDYKNLSLNL